jgi:imidazoleglycerol phosphate dehydratase HisB
MCVPLEILEIDDHHTNEDVGITLGQALLQALGDKKGSSVSGILSPLSMKL